jgi:hypothetical protein
VLSPAPALPGNRSSNDSAVSGCVVMEY